MGPQRPNNHDARGPGLASIARHGVVHRVDLRALGLSRSDVEYRVRTGRLFRRYPDVFAVGRPDLPLDGEFLAAVLACGPRAVLSHRSALRKWGLRGGGTIRIDVSAPRSIKPKAGIRLHRPRSLDALATTELDGISITTVAQTLLDVAADLGVGRLLHEAAIQQVLDMRAIARVLALNPNAPGARRLEAALKEEVPFTRSGLEDAALALFRRSSVPEPECNAWVWDGERLVEVDFLWREYGLIVEVDGSRYHSTRWRRRRDAAKTAALEGLGWTVLRFSDIEIAGTPADVVSAILAAMRGPPTSE